MTKEDIIRMARESDLLTTTEPNGYQIWIPENLKAFANLVAVAEREACAKVCEELPIVVGLRQMQRATLKDAAYAIRARGQE